MSIVNMHGQVNNNIMPFLQDTRVGTKNYLSQGIQSRVDLIKHYTNLPVVVGFGVSNSDHVRTIAQVADGVVVGSAIVNCIAQNLDKQEAIGEALQEKMQSLLEANALKG